jgi:hypothetical protein
VQHHAESGADIQFAPAMFEHIAGGGAPTPPPTNNTKKTAPIPHQMRTECSRFFFRPRPPLTRTSAENAYA